MKVLMGAGKPGWDGRLFPIFSKQCNVVLLYLYNTLCSRYSWLKLKGNREITPTPTQTLIPDKEKVLRNLSNTVAEETGPSDA